jgi:hypothetical protein
MGTAKLWGAPKLSHNYGNTGKGLSTHGHLFLPMSTIIIVLYKKKHISQQHCSYNNYEATTNWERYRI